MTKRNNPARPAFHDICRIGAGEAVTDSIAVSMKVSLRVRSKTFTGLVSLALFTISASGIADAQKAQKPPQPAAPKPTQTLPVPQAREAFYLSPLPDQPGYYSLLIGDRNNRTVYGNFREEQLRVFEAVVSEAIKFSKTEEEPGKITRFADNSETALIVDVEKKGVESRYYLTLTYLNTRLTIPAGAIRRNDREKDPEKELPLLVKLHGKLAEVVGR
jgi:hypothetical protein